MTDLVQRLRDMCGNEIPIDKAMVPADEWRMAMAEIQVLKDEYIWKLSEVSQLQEQNTYLDKVSSELQDLCDMQAKRLAEAEKDAARYQWLVAYFVSDRTDQDDAIVAASEVDVAQVTAVIDAAMVAK